MSIRDSKNYPKSIVKYLSEDRKVSEEAMISFQNGTKECILYMDLGYSDLFVIITIVFPC